MACVPSGKRTAGRGGRSRGRTHQGRPAGSCANLVSALQRVCSITRRTRLMRSLRVPQAGGGLGWSPPAPAGPRLRVLLAPSTPPRGVPAVRLGFFFFPLGGLLRGAAAPDSE